MALLWIGLGALRKMKPYQLWAGKQLLVVDGHLWVSFTVY